MYLVGYRLINRYFTNNKKESLMKKLLFSLFAGLMLSFNAFAAVNLNTATQAELEAVKGIGPSKSQAIIDYRTKNGPFKSVDDLDNVKGFGKKSVDKIRGDITVSGATSAKVEKPKTVGNDTAAAVGKTANTKTAKDSGKKDDKASAKTDKKK